MFLISDLQISLYQENIVAHAEVGKLFDPSTILTSSGGSGPNSLLPKEVIKTYPVTPLMCRQGEVN